ncbi:MAG: hypothetical protein EOO85_11820 [Pedobacter sp.]|nr:MAG: hypothetical protein EOO85_11820 [Pedobacter sp.]
MALTKVLIAVKTYPTISSKYDELVCTAGFKEDGTWIRIYPIPFRKKDYGEQYRKYDWVEIDLVKNTSDFRPESYRPHSHDTEIKITGHLDTNSNWYLRKQHALRKIYTNMTKLIEEAHDQSVCTSLAVFRPKRFIGFETEEVSREWDKKKLDSLEAERLQFNLFKQPENPFEVVKKLPYKFKYVFEDEQGKISKMMIEDWEIGELYWKSLAAHEGDEHKAISAVKNQYFTKFTNKNDLHLFLGTNYVHHYASKNPFMIIGAFYPKLETQMNLF